MDNRKDIKTSTVISNLKLKVDESIKVVPVDVVDCISYDAHSSEVIGIESIPCRGERHIKCPFCIAYENGGEAYNSLRKVRRNIMAFVLLEGDHDIGILDIDDDQRSNLRMEIDECWKEIQAKESGFELSKVIEEGCVKFRFTPLSERWNKKNKLIIRTLIEKQYNLDIFKEKLTPMTREHMVHILDESGMCIEDHFPKFVVKKARRIGHQKYDSDEGESNSYGYSHMSKQFRNFYVSASKHSGETSVYLNNRIIHGSFTEICDYFKKYPNYYIKGLFSLLDWGDSLKYFDGEIYIERDWKSHLSHTNKGLIKIAWCSPQNNLSWDELNFSFNCHIPIFTRKTIINGDVRIVEWFKCGERKIFVGTQRVYGDFNEICRYFVDNPDSYWNSRSVLAPEGTVIKVENDNLIVIKPEIEKEEKKEYSVTMSKKDYDAYQSYLNKSKEK